MTTVRLHEFVTTHREELIHRCRAKSKAQSLPPLTAAEVDGGVPLFLDQLVDTLRQGRSTNDEISTGAVQYGRDLLLGGFTVGEVVHDYGNVCQAITELAVELAAPIDADDFRVLNGCLDDAIASAVTQFARQQAVNRDGRTHELRSLLTAALVGFEMLQTGSVGVGGSTGDTVHRTLLDMCALVDPQAPD